jgi:hypothetical protein
MDKIRNEDIGEQTRKPIELTEDELALASGGNADDGPWCGTKPPGWSPVTGPHGPHAA